MLLSEAWRSLTANLSTTFAAAITVLIGMALVGMLVGFGTYARAWTDKTKKELVVNVYFCTDQTCAKYATGPQIDRVRIKLQKNPLVKNVKFISKEEAFWRCEVQPGPDRAVPNNPLPDASTSPRSRASTSTGSQEPEAVSGGSRVHPLRKKTAHKILNVAHLIEVLFLVAVIILLFASTLLIANTIRLSIFSRRREIEVMKLVGASNWFMRGPFMLEGLFTGLIGAILAVILLFIGKETVVSSIWFKDQGVHALAFALNGLILVALGLLLGAAASMLTLRRFLKV